MPCLRMLLFPYLLLVCSKKEDKKGGKKRKKGGGKKGKKKKMGGRKKRGKRGGKWKKGKKKKIKKSSSKRSSQCAPLIDRSPAKQIFCQIVCPKSKPRTQQAPLPVVLPTKQESVKPPVPIALLKSPRDTSPVSPRHRLLYSGVSNVPVHRGFGLAPAFGLG